MSAASPVLAAGSYGLVHATEQVAELQPMVNLSVAEAHTFFVGDDGWLVHNWDPPRPELFDRAGIKTTRHFQTRLCGRESRGINERDALETYRRGRLFFDPKDRTYIRRDSKTGINVAVDAVCDGTALTVFEGNNPSPRWIPIKWRPGQTR